MEQRQSQRQNRFRNLVDKIKRKRLENPHKRINKYDKNFKPIGSSLYNIIDRKKPSESVCLQVPHDKNLSVKGIKLVSELVRRTTKPYLRKGIPTYVLSARDGYDGIGKLTITGQELDFTPDTKIKQLGLLSNVWKLFYNTNKSELTVKLYMKSQEVVAALLKSIREKCPMIKGYRINVQRQIRTNMDVPAIPNRAVHSIDTPLSVALAQLFEHHRSKQEQTLISTRDIHYSRFKICGVEDWLIEHSKTKAIAKKFLKLKTIMENNDPSSRIFQLAWFKWLQLEDSDEVSAEMRLDMYHDMSNQLFEGFIRSIQSYQNDFYITFYRKVAGGCTDHAKEFDLDRSMIFPEGLMRFRVLQSRAEYGKNNCGIAAVSECLPKSKTGTPIRHSTVRRRLGFLENSEITPEQMGQIAMEYNFHLTIYQAAEEITEMGKVLQYNEQAKECIEVLLYKPSNNGWHYVRILEKNIETSEADAGKKELIFNHFIPTNVQVTTTPIYNKDGSYKRDRHNKIKMRARYKAIEGSVNEKPNSKVVQGFKCEHCGEAFLQKSDSHRCNDNHLGYYMKMVKKWPEVIATYDMETRDEKCCTREQTISIPKEDGEVNVLTYYSNEYRQKCTLIVVNIALSNQKTIKQRFFGVDQELQMVNFLVDLCKRMHIRIVIYGHNAAKFDSILLYNSIFKRPECHVNVDKNSRIVCNGRLLQFTYGGLVTFRDGVCHLSGSLKDVYRNFGIDDGKKELFTIDGVEYTNMDICKLHPELSPEQFVDWMNRPENEKYRSAYFDYCDHDVQGYLIALQKYSRTMKNELMPLVYGPLLEEVIKSKKGSDQFLDPLKCLTAPGYSYKNWQLWHKVKFQEDAALLPKQIANWIRGAMIGGRSISVPGDYQNCCYFDIVSMYASVMCYFEYPFGQPIKTDCEVPGKMGVYNVKSFKYPDNFGICIVPNKNPETGKLDQFCEVVNDRVLTSVDIQNCREHGCVVEVKDGIYWEKTYNPFKEYLMPFVNRKRQEDVLKMNKKPFNKILRELCKLMANSLYGKMLEQDHDLQFDFVTDGSSLDMERFLHRKARGTVMETFPRQGTGFFYTFTSDEEGAEAQKPTQLGVFVLSWSRWLLDHYIDAVGRRNICMVETDSMVFQDKFYPQFKSNLEKLAETCDLRDIDGQPLFREADDRTAVLGNMKNELGGEMDAPYGHRIQRFITCGCKTYYMSNCEGKPKMIWKGVSRTRESRKHPEENPNKELVGQPGVYSGLCLEMYERNLKGLPSIVMNQIHFKKVLYRTTTDQEAFTVSIVNGIKVVGKHE